MFRHGGRNLECHGFGGPTIGRFGLYDDKDCDSEQNEKFLHFVLPACRQAGFVESLSVSKKRTKCLFTKPECI